MTGKKNPAHQLVQVNEHPGGGDSATCSCGRWGYAGASTMKRLQEKHAEHIQEAGGGR